MPKLIVIEKVAPSEKTYKKYNKAKETYYKWLIAFCSSSAVLFCYLTHEIQIMFPSDVNFKLNIFIERAARHSIELIILGVVTIATFYIFAKLLNTMHVYVKLAKVVEIFEEQHKFASLTKDVTNICYFKEYTEGDLIELNFIKKFKNYTVQIPDREMVLTDLKEDANIIIDFIEHKIYSKP